MKKRLSETGNQCDKGVLLENQVEKNPFTQFDKWLREAEKSGIIEPNAMSLSTVSKEGKPSSRMVFLKGIDKGGLLFFTNYSSRKGLEMMFQPHIALLFFPVMFEFWQGRKNRLHDRIRYTKTGNGWKINRLAP
ncbi:MAG: hypothetical protein FJY10_07535 [Bacteroidetes bacterium]|nr:hypothetical protein [Bacteroidota bacterium]